MKGSQIVGKAAHQLVRNRASVQDIYAHIRVPKEGLPNAQANPYRKRPTAVTYDSDEYHRCLMPSERAFIFSGISFFSLRHGRGRRDGRKEEPKLLSSNRVPLEARLGHVYRDDRFVSGDAGVRIWDGG